MTESSRPNSDTRVKMRLEVHDSTVSIDNIPLDKSEGYSLASLGCYPMLPGQLSRKIRIEIR